MAAEKKLDENTKKKLNEAIKKAWEFVKAMEDLGVRMPELVKSIKALESAIAVGKDVGKAAQQASDSLARYTQNLRDLCGTILDDGDQTVCLAQVERQWQMRNLDFTLNLKNRDSVPRNFIRTQLERLLPESICKAFDLCKE